MAKAYMGDAPPPFEEAASLQRFLDLVMEHYNTVLASLDAPGGYEPILDTDPRTGEILWEMWIDGFAAAMKLAPTGWNLVRASDDAGAKAALAGIIELAAASGGPIPADEEQQRRLDQLASDFIPIWVQMLHEWRLDNEANKPAAGRTKVGRNDPCSCGSGKKYEKCCALN